jgi:hypothetical protein
VNSAIPIVFLVFDVVGVDVGVVVSLAQSKFCTSRLQCDEELRVVHII